jgi:hypothetical protein
MKNFFKRIFGGAGDRLRLPEMLKLRGAALPESMGEAAARDAAIAFRRCQLCSAKGVCDAYLKADNPETYRGFCPNAAYIESLREKNKELT